MDEQHDEQHEQEHIGRRRLLRGAGAVVAGVAGAGVAGAVAATPAAADPDGNFILGVPNIADSETQLTFDDPDIGATGTAALRLTRANGPVLRADPVDINTPFAGLAPPGSLFVDAFGDIVTVGQPNPAEDKYSLLLYSPTWATMTIPITPLRILDTRNPNQRDTLFYNTPDSLGRIFGDAFVSLSDLASFAYGVQLTATVDRASRNAFLAVWGGGVYPGHSSVNFTPSFPISNFVQSELGFDSATENIGVSIRVSGLAAVIIDVVGFIVSDPFVDLNPSVAPNGVQAKSARPKPTRRAGSQLKQYER